MDFLTVLSSDTGALYDTHAIVVEAICLLFPIGVVLTVVLGLNVRQREGFNTQVRVCTSSLRALGTLEATCSQLNSSVRLSFFYPFGAALLSATPPPPRTRTRVGLAFSSWRWFCLLRLRVPPVCVTCVFRRKCFRFSGIPGIAGFETSLLPRSDCERRHLGDLAGDKNPQLSAGFATHTV